MKQSGTVHLFALACLAAISEAQDEIPNRYIQVDHEEFEILSGVYIALTIATGFEKSGEELSLFIDVILDLEDENGLLTASNDPSYITREVFFQSMDNFEHPDWYATEVQKVQGGSGITYTGYQSTTSRYDLTDSADLTDIDIIQSYDPGSDVIYNTGGSLSDDHWQLSDAGTEVPSSTSSSCRLKKIITDDVSGYWKDHRKDSVSYGIVVSNSNSGQEYLNSNRQTEFIYEEDPVMVPEPMKEHALDNVLVSSIYTISLISAAFLL